MDPSQARPRINGSMLPKFHGKSVVLLGKGTTSDPGGMTFPLETCDGQTVTIKLQQPIQDYVHGLVEVHGVVNNDNSIGAHEYIVLADSMTQPPFDMENYNKAVELMHRASDHYLTGASEQ